MSTDSTATRPKSSNAILAIISAAIACLVIWVGAVKIARVDLTADVGAGPQPVGSIAVIAAASLSGFAAWGLLWLMNRFFRNGRTIWTIVVIGLALASLAGPVSSAGSTTAALILAGMHVATAAIVIPVLRWSAAE
jgi:hypothetical protein